MKTAAARLAVIRRKVVELEKLLSSGEVREFPLRDLRQLNSGVRSLLFSVESAIRANGEVP
mgnify:CR=1 FL=1